MRENVWAWILDREKRERGYMYRAIASVNSMLSNQVVFLSQKKKKMQGIISSCETAVLEKQINPLK